MHRRSISESQRHRGSLALRQWAQTPTLRTACREILQGPSGEKPGLIPRTRKAAESKRPTANQRPINIRSPTDPRHIITPRFTEHRNGTSRSRIHRVKREKRHQPTCSVRSSTCLSVHLSVCGRSSTCLSAGWEDAAAAGRGRAPLHPRMWSFRCKQ